MISIMRTLLAMVGPLGAANNDFMRLFREPPWVPLPALCPTKHCQIGSFDVSEFALRPRR